MKRPIVHLNWECDSAAKNETIQDQSYQIQLAITLLHVLFMHDVIIL